MKCGRAVISVIFYIEGIFIRRFHQGISGRLPRLPLSHCPSIIKGNAIIHRMAWRAII